MSTNGTGGVLTLAEIGGDAPRALLARFGIGLETVVDGAAIPGSYWGAPEAGVRGMQVYARSDTPLHSLLHEASHIICMNEARRRGLDTDAGGDDLEEAAVCYLQIVLADRVAGAGRERLMRDMDAWGYSFRLGNTNRWFYEDAGDALAWLVAQGLLTPGGQLAFRLRIE
jgi:hypothetical protein